MPNLPFTLRQLEVFASLCATRSFRRTAETLGISQASVSNQIKALEEQLGLSLLSRATWQAAEPDAGRDVVPRGFARRSTRPGKGSPATAARHRIGRARRRYRIRVGQGLVDHFIRPKLDRFSVAEPEYRARIRRPAAELSLCPGHPGCRFDFALLHLRADRPVDPVDASAGDGPRRDFRPPQVSRGPQGAAYGRRDVAPAVRLAPGRQPAGAGRSPGIRGHGIVPRKVVSHTQFFDVIGTMLERGLAVASFSEVMLAPGGAGATWCCSIRSRTGA